MNEDVLGRADALAPPLTPSLTPAGKMTQQLALILLLAVALVIALIGGLYRIESQGFWNTLSTIVGGAIGVLTLRGGTGGRGR